MKRFHQSRLMRVIISITLLCGTSTAQVLLDSSGEFDTLRPVGMNDEGTVVFLGTKDSAGGNESFAGIFTVSSGGQVDTVVDENGPFTAAGSPWIIEDGQVIFYGAIDDGGDDEIYGTYRGTNVDFTGNLGMDTIIDNIDPMVWDGPNPGNCGIVAANDLGDVLFCVRGGAFPSIWVRLGEPPVGCFELPCEFRELDQPSQINTHYAMNNNRKVAFVETDSLTLDSKLKVSDFSTDPAETVTLIDTEIDDFDSIHNGIDINNLNQIAFVGRKDPTSSLGVYKIVPGGDPETVIEPGTFAISGPGIAINDMGQIAFHASNLGAGFGNGYFITPNLEEPIIQNGDALGDSEIIFFNSSDLITHAFNNKGQLVIGAHLANDMRVIAIAQDSNPINEIFWEANNGDFDDPLNWEPQAVPDEEVTAVFDRDAIYSVNILEAYSDRAIVERGAVEFNGGAYDVSGGNENDASIVVGHTSEDPASLNLRNAHDLGATHATIGEGANTSGILTVAEESALSVEGRLVVGKKGQSILQIAEGGSVISSETQIGAEGGGNGTVFVNGNSSKGLIAPWTTGNLAVGLVGTGTVGIQDAEVISDTAVLGVIVDSSGSVEVDGKTASWVLDSDLIVGDSGDGDLLIKEGALVLAASRVTIGKATGATGLAQVIGTDPEDVDKPSLLSSLTDRIDVGDQGDGELRVLEGASVTTPEGVTVGSGGEGLLRVVGIEDGPLSTVDCEEMHVGFANSGILEAEHAFVNVFGDGTVGGLGQGFVNLKSAAWLSGDGELIIGSLFGDTIVGSGTVTLQEDGVILVGKVILNKGSLVTGVGYVGSQFENLGGSVAPGVSVAKSKSGNPSRVPKQTPTFGTLTVTGDYIQEDGKLVIEVGGLAAGQYDILNVTGSADLRGGTIEFVFANGYLPQMGDQVAFLIADGTTSVSNLTTIYEGVAEGFEIEVTEENGMLMFEALNDAQPEGGEPTPLPTALNPNADVNNDNIIDANDLLEVMRNWYHVVVE